MVLKDFERPAPAGSKLDLREKAKGAPKPKAQSSWPGRSPGDALMLDAKTQF